MTPDYACGMGVEGRPALAVADPDEWRSTSRPIADPELRAVLEDVLDRAASLTRLDVGQDGRSSDPTLDVDRLRAVLDRVHRSVVEALRDEAPGGPSHPRLLDLLLDARALDDRVVAVVEADREAAFDRVREAMAALRDAATVDQMLARAPVAASRLGFDRAFVSAIERSCFIPQACFIQGDPEWAAAVVQAGKERPRRLDQTLAETEIVRRRAPIRVLDVQRDPRVHREIAEVSMSRSYVAAPVVVRGQVVGFLHADYFAQRRLVSALDRDMLWMFSEAFGQAFEGVALAARMSTLRQVVKQAAATTDGTVAWAVDGELPLTAEASAPAVDAPGAPPAAGPRVAAISGGPEIDELLTRREREVLRLMAAGETNGGIADRLVISHGTAKTHVKHILRKLRASNRAEAVSRYLQIEHRRAHGDG